MLGVDDFVEGGVRVGIGAAADEGFALKEGDSSACAGKGYRCSEAGSACAETRSQTTVNISCPSVPLGPASRDVSKSDEQAAATPVRMTSSTAEDGRVLTPGESPRKTGEYRCFGAPRQV